MFIQNKNNYTELNLNYVKEKVVGLFDSLNA